ncbi:MAG: PGPGW domain-containing protein [Myxococcota bacterium]
MLRRAHKKWHELKASPPGERFHRFYVAEQNEPRWVRLIYLGLGLAMLPVGVVFAFIPGPAVLFFALGAALLATHSEWVARKLDEFELWLHRTWTRIRPSTGGKATSSRHATRP